MRYGLPYLGSKNGIAEWVISNLPKADTFVDLFFGGGSITHAGLLSGKYKNFIANDIDNRLPLFFTECIRGEHTVDTHKEWVTKEEFNKKKKEDIFISSIWSFSNNGVDYLYGKDIAKMKQCLHNAVFFNDLEPLKEFGINLQKSFKESIYDRYLDYSRQIKNRSMSLETLERIHALETLKQLQILEPIQTFGTDYQDITIPDGALIYCDVPYKDTRCCKYDGFDHDRFYEWADKQDNIYISEYSMPDNFIPVARKEKMVLCTREGGSPKTVETIFTNERTYLKLSDDKKRLIDFCMAEQMTFFDYI